MRKELKKELKKIPKSRVTTYKALALKLKTSPRAVGKMLNTNIELIKIPCHRVVKNNGEIGGYKNGLKEKIRLLEEEGVRIKNNKILNFKDFLLP